MVIIANITLFICSIALSLFIYAKINSIIDEHNKLEDECDKYRSTLDSISKTQVDDPLSHPDSYWQNTEKLRIAKLEAFSAKFSGDLKRKKQTKHN